MRPLQRAFRFSGPGTLAWLVLVLCSATALSQPTQDCTVPSRLPNGPTTYSLAYCAIQHAHFLYARRCTVGEDCAIRNKPVVDAYKNAEHIFSLYLASRDTHNMLVDDHIRADDSFTSGLLQERAHYYSNALSNYLRCQKLLRPSQPGDSLAQECSKGLFRLSCVQNPSQTVCQDSGGERRTVVITTRTTSSGGRTTSAGDDYPGADNTPKDRTSSSNVSIKLPTADEISEINKSMTEKEKLDLKQAIEQNKVSVTAKQPY